MNNICKILAAAVLVVHCCGCVQTLYDWGSYEDSLLRMYEDAELDIASEIVKLSQEVQHSIDADRAVPPGKMAYLGYLHYLNGDRVEAARYFEAEKAAFPESSVFIDGLISRIES